ncbi:MAG TPA: hypothetical protein VFG43_06035 [Geminicoccaceae bacterium]|nr:hypothetical protein [Geminicoccaceae bacterium]
MMPRLNLVWPRDTLTEWGWFRQLFERLDVVHHVDPELRLVEPNTIYITDRPAALPAAFLERAARVPNLGLCHISDEWFAGGYGNYGRFDLVLRNYRARRFAHPRILTLPLGYGRHTPARTAVRDVRDRRDVWFFAGTAIATRRHMARCLEPIEPHRLHLYDWRDTAERLGAAGYHAALDETMFAPCPMGNVHLETNRIYEALEAGCIPIVETRRHFPHLDILLGPHPLLEVRSWREAPDLVRRLLGEPERLRALQLETLAWWEACKRRLQDELGRHLERHFAPSPAAPAPQRWRFAEAPRFWGYGEMLKHHSLVALVARSRLTVERALHRR